MTRAIAFLVRNWPLKLAAIALATMLYAGLVLTQSARGATVNVQIDAVGVPENAVLLGQLPVVTNVTYVSSESTVSSDSFVATVDLSGVDPNAGPQLVDVDLTSIPGTDVSPITWFPRRIRVDLDPIRSKSVPVVVETGTVPAALTTDEPVIGANSVTVKGPASLVDRVVLAQATVTIEPSGFDVDRDAVLVPLDAAGEKVTEVDLDPETVHVSIHVFENIASRTLPVTVPVVGSPPPGFTVGAITTDPAAVSVGGEAAELGPLQFVQTDAVPLTNRTSDIVVRVALDLPDGIVALDATEVEVRIPIRPLSETRLFQVGLELSGERNDLQYSVGRDRVLVTLKGSPPDLDRLGEAGFVADLDVSDLGPGGHSVRVRVDLPAGLELVTVSPATVRVDVTEPVASPAPPSPSPVPSPSP